MLGVQLRKFVKPGGPAYFQLSIKRYLNTQVQRFIILDSSDYYIQGKFENIYNIRDTT